MSDANLFITKCVCSTRYVNRMLLSVIYYLTQSNLAQFDKFSLIPQDVTQSISSNNLSTK